MERGNEKREKRKRMGRYSRRQKNKTKVLLITRELHPKTRAQDDQEGTALHSERIAVNLSRKYYNRITRFLYTVPP